MPELSEVTPRIGTVEPISMTCDYQLPWDRQSNQTACGQTIQYQNGDKNWRIVISGIISIDQFRALNSMRGEDEVEVRTAEFGTQKVTFDQLNVTRAGDENTARIDDELGPKLEFQLQTKELSSSDEPAVEFINE